MTIDPSLVLGVLLGILNAALYVVIRGSAGGRLPLLVGAAVLGALAGDALGDRLGFHLFSIGDFRLVGAAIGAWAGLGLVSVVAILGPTAKRP